MDEGRDKRREEERRVETDEGEEKSAAPVL